MTGVAAEAAVAVGASFQKAAAGCGALLSVDGTGDAGLSAAAGGTAGLPKGLALVEGGVAGLPKGLAPVLLGGGADGLPKAELAVEAGIGVTVEGELVTGAADAAAGWLAGAAGLLAD